MRNEIKENAKRFVDLLLHWHGLAEVAAAAAAAEEEAEAQRGSSPHSQDQVHGFNEIRVY